MAKVSGRKTMSSADGTIHHYLIEVKKKGKKEQIIQIKLKYNNLHDHRVY